MNRLGNGGTAEVKMHPWLRDVEWGLLMDKRVKAPYVPQNKDNFDPKIIKDWDDQIDPSTIRQAAVQELFDGYNYDIRDTNKLSTNYSTK